MRHRRCRGSGTFRKGGLATLGSCPRLCATLVSPSNTTTTRWVRDHGEQTCFLPPDVLLADLQACATCLLALRACPAPALRLQASAVRLNTRPTGRLRSQFALLRSPALALCFCSSPALRHAREALRRLSTHGAGRLLGHLRTEPAGRRAHTPRVPRRRRVRGVLLPAPCPPLSGLCGRRNLADAFRSHVLQQSREGSAPPVVTLGSCSFMHIREARAKREELATQPGSPQPGSAEQRVHHGGHAGQQQRGCSLQVHEAGALPRPAGLAELRTLRS